MIDTQKKKKYHLDYYHANKDKYRERNLIASRKHRAKDQANRLVISAKSRAKKRGIDFEITKEDIVIPEYCPYLGCKLTNITGRGHVWSNASIDRIDSSKAYTRDNIQIISHLANQMKSNATPEQLIAFANGILKIYGGHFHTETPSQQGQLQ
jgi:hypothetical protein